MVDAKRQPTNINHLTPIAYRFNIRKIPNVIYFCQAVNIPGISFPETVQRTPFTNINIPGDTLVYEDLTIRFLVDEDLQAYKEIFDWMSALTAPKAFTQYKTERDTNKVLRRGTGNLFSSAELIILNNNMNPNKEIIFDDVFPTSLSSIEFDSGSTLDTLSATVTFKYTTYSINSVNAARTAASTTGTQPASFSKQ